MSVKTKIGEVVKSSDEQLWMENLQRFKSKFTFLSLGASSSIPTNFRQKHSK